MDLPCNICLGVADALIADLESGVPIEDTIAGITSLCSLLLWDRDVCVGLLNANIVRMFKKKSYITNIFHENKQRAIFDVI